MAQQRNFDSIYGAVPLTFIPRSNVTKAPARPAGLALARRFA